MKNLKYRFEFILPLIVLGLIFIMPVLENSIGDIYPFTNFFKCPDFSQRCFSASDAFIMLLIMPGYYIYGFSRNNAISVMSIIVFYSFVGYLIRKALKK